jgi:beta-glucosidase
VSVARRADAVVLCVGLSSAIEGEQGDASNSDEAGDKAHLGLTGLQDRLISEVVAVGKPTVLVLVSGSPLAVGSAADAVGAVIQAWYPGEEAGTALADVLFGHYNPAGRLPITFPRSLDDVPDFKSYSMVGRTYRYLEKEPLFPFGYGLSYTRFEYTDARVSKERIAAGDEIELSVTVENVGERTGDEVIELYVSDLDASCRVPRWELRGFSRITLAPGESRRVAFTLGARDLSLIDERGVREVSLSRGELP